MPRDAIRFGGDAIVITTCPLCTRDTCAAHWGLVVVSLGLAYVRARVCISCQRTLGIGKELTAPVDGHEEIIQAIESIVDTYLKSLLASHAIQSNG